MKTKIQKLNDNLKERNSLDREIEIKKGELDGLEYKGRLLEREWFKLKETPHLMFRH